MRPLIIAIFISLALASNAQVYKVVFYDRLDKSLEDSIVSDIKNTFHCQTVVEYRSFPKNTAKRDKGWDARSLVNKVAAIKPDSVKRIIAITTQPVFDQKDATTSWGLYGFSVDNPGAVVISTTMINGALLISRIHKVIIHEITHTYGVKHCSSDRCVMNPGKGYLAELDASFDTPCEACRKKASEWQWN